MNKHFHFIGIGGIGMGAIASLLLDKGYSVSGSDIKENGITKNLQKKGANIFIGHNADNVKDANFVVYSSAVKPQNPEMLYAKKKKIAVFKRAQLLANLMSGHKSITVAGAHGKTTTTSMISNLLIKAGLEPTIAVGGIIQGSSTNAALGDSQFFVAEVDESDGSFLYFSPYYSVITNIDFEHLDYYGNISEIIKAYRQFIDRTHFDGIIFACGEDQRLICILKESKREFVTYGIDGTFDIRAYDIRHNGFSSSFYCVYRGRTLGKVELNVPGRHNVMNALACISLGLALDINFSVIIKSLSAYQGVQRRFQLKSYIDDITIVDDYGHHPTEIRETLKTAKSMDPKRLIVVFQPHRYTRTKYLMDEFVDALMLSDSLIITDIYAAGEKQIEGVSSKVLYDKISRFHKSVSHMKKEDVAGYISKIAESGDLIITLGAGDISRISDDIVSQIKKIKISEDSVT